MDILTKVQERQVSAKKYLEEYDIENIISEMLNSLLHDKDPHPYVYMIKYLASLMTEDERKEFGLEIPEPYPTAYPVVKYPHFKEESNNLLKKYLSKENAEKHNIESQKIFQQIQQKLTKNSQEHKVLSDYLSQIFLNDLIMTPLISSNQTECEKEVKNFADKMVELANN